MPRAVFNGTVLAEADHTVVVEGNHYFPPESLNQEHLQESSSKTVCPWKGLASYHDIVVDGHVHPNAGWYYPHPSPLAHRIRDHVAFDHRVTAEPTDHDVPRPRFLDRHLAFIEQLFAHHHRHGSCGLTPPGRGS